MGYIPHPCIHLRNPLPQAQASAARAILAVSLDLQTHAASSSPLKPRPATGRGQCLGADGVHYSLQLAAELNPPPRRAR